MMCLFITATTFGVTALTVIFLVDYTAQIPAIVCKILKQDIAANLITMRFTMDCAAMKMSQRLSEEEVGQAVRGLGTTSLDFIAVLVKTGLETLTNLGVAK